MLNDDRWDTWIQRFLNNYSSKIKPIHNYEYCKTLINIRIKDASFYTNVYYSESQNGKLSPTTIALWELKKQISKDNISELDDLITKWGWPQFSEYGSFASMAFLVVQHADLETQKRYLPIITDAYNQGEAYFNWVAMLTDRILLRERKPQIYGSQSIWNPNINKYVLYQVEDVEKMNELRIEHKIGEPISNEITKNMYKPEE